MTTEWNKNGTALETHAIVRAASTSLEPTSFGELKELAKHAAGSQFFGAKTPEQALMIMMAGKDLGLSYTQALRVFHVIQGRPVLSADGMAAVCLQHDACEYFRVEGDDTKATAYTKRRGQPEQSSSFSMEDAKRASLTGKDNWKAYPSRMLKARAKANLARDVYPELLAGLYDPDELEARPAPQYVEHVAEPVVVYDPQARATFLDAIEQATSPASLKETAKAIKAAETRGILTPDDGEALKGPYTAKMDALKESKRRTVDTATTTPAPAPTADEDIAAAIDRGDA